MAKRPAHHVKAQKEGKKRDFYTCQVCGSTEKTEGHHIIDYAFGGAGVIDNIITLCHKCHQGVHKGNIDLIKF